MILTSHMIRLVHLMVLASCLAAVSPVVAAKRAPAGQMCPQGSYVIGFDSESNIICSVAGENQGAPVADIQDSCAADCEPEDVNADKAVATENVSAEQDFTPTVSALSISDVKPSYIVFGTREVEITIIGAGFVTGSLVIFAGREYSPSVDPAGTRLMVTVPTRDLSIGPYALTVINGAGVETTLRKALEVY